MTTTILRTATHLLVPLSLVFAMFIFFRGHQMPGGGFVGGLVASVALVIHRMAHGSEQMRRLLPIRERVLIAVGLLLAGAGGLGALAAGLPYLSSAFGYVHLPGGDNGYPLEWSTALLFDVGVFLVVTGTVVGMISALTDEVDGRAEDIEEEGEHTMQAADPHGGEEQP